ncbi:uncharacterized protein LOC144649387 [Oculina patagonica]
MECFKTETIVWSDQSCTLKTFVARYNLPQLVKVEDGFYSEDDGETLSADDILMLHSIKRTENLLVEDAEHKEYLLPLNSPCKVEILPKLCQDRYDSVEDAVDAWTHSADFKFIRVAEVYSCSPSLRIRAGDILEPRKTVTENHVKFLQCVFYGQTEYLVKLPFNVKAAFEPLASREPVQFEDILHSFELPVRVKFTSSCITTTQNANSNNIDFQSLGPVFLQELRQGTPTAIIATLRDVDMTPVADLTIPIDLDVNVCPAREAVIGNEDYVRFCEEIHHGTEHTKVNLYENGCKSFEEPTVDPVVDVDHEYEEIKPLPPKPKPKPKPNRRPVPTYENLMNDDVLEAPKEGPSNFEGASPHDCKEDSKYNVEDDEEDTYLSSDCDSDEDYIFVEPIHNEQIYPSNIDADDETPPPRPRRVESLGRYRDNQ